MLDRGAEFALIAMEIESKARYGTPGYSACSLALYSTPEYSRARSDRHGDGKQDCQREVDRNHPPRVELLRAKALAGVLEQRATYRAH